MRRIQRYHWPIGTCFASIRHRCDIVCQYLPNEVLARPTREVTNTVNTASFGAFLWKFQVNFSLILTTGCPLHTSCEERFFILIPLFCVTAILF